MIEHYKSDLVELLRCAHDEGSLVAACVALDRLDLEDDAHVAAYSVGSGWGFHVDWTWADACLEAAQRIEEGTLRLTDVVNDPVLCIAIAWLEQPPTTLDQAVFHGDALADRVLSAAMPRMEHEPLFGKVEF